jgi:hypothetical protein
LSGTQRTVPADPVGPKSNASARPSVRSGTETTATPVGPAVDGRNYAATSVSLTSFRDSISWRTLAATEGEASRMLRNSAGEPA